VGRRGGWEEEVQGLMIKTFQRWSLLQTFGQCVLRADYRSTGERKNITYWEGTGTGGGKKGDPLNAKRVGIKVVSNPADFFEGEKEE